MPEKNDNPKNDNPKHADHNQRKLTVVVNGEPEVVKVSVNATLQTLIPLALGNNHPGQPPENWQIQDVKGNLLDPGKKIADYAFPENVILYLSLKAGIGG